MAEITKVTSPMIPQENLASKNRPLTEQTFEINNPGRVNKPDQEKNIRDHEGGGQAAWDNLNRAAVQPLLRGAGDLMLQIQKMISLLQMGISTSDVMQSEDARALMQKIFTTPEQLLDMLLQQDDASVLFKGETFDVLRDILARFDDNPKVRDAVLQVIKTFEHHVNAENSVKTILLNCENLLDYMFSRDREQFASYLESLSEMLLPADKDAEAAGNAPQPGAEGGPLVDAEGKPVLDAEGKPVLDAEGKPVLDAQGKPLLDAQGKPVLDAQGRPVLLMEEPDAPKTLSQQEASRVLKNNLLPLLGEVVVKYHQNAHIRDIVMVVVHNIVRVDKGTPEALRESVANLVSELRKVAGLPENFERSLMQAVDGGVKSAKQSQNEVVSRLVDVIRETLNNPAASSPASLRQAENLLMSMLQNQSALMDVLHFVLPMQMGDDRLFMELYVDPDSEENSARPGEKSRKFFLTVNSENHGMIEMSILQTSERITFAMWCPDSLVRPLTGMRRTVGNIIQAHGYTMSGYSVSRLERPKSVVEVFPGLLNRKVGIDVRI